MAKKRTVVLVVMVLVLALCAVVGCSSPHVTKQYQVQRVATMEDLDWNLVEHADISLYKWTTSANPTAYAQLVLVEDFGLVCKLSCNERNPFTQRTEDGQDVWNDSALELFISFDGKDYLNIESNSVGAKVIEYGPSRTDRTQVWQTIPGLFTVEALLDADGWSVVDYMPFESVRQLCPEITPESFAAGKTMTANFYKTGTDDVSADVHHYGMWNEVDTEKPDFHQSKYFGTLTF